MAPGRHPFFRKIIIPWYDSDAVCIACIVFLGGVSIFSIIGLSAALEDPACYAHVWVPLVLMVLSLGATASMLARVLKRFTDRRFR